LSDPLSSSWTVIEARTDGIFTGATYNLDTSNGFWRTTLNYGVPSVGIAASITWSNGLSYQPLTTDEIITITFSAEIKKVSSNTSDVYPFALIVEQGSNTQSIVLTGGGNTDWATFTNSALINFNNGGLITFAVSRYNSNSINVYTPREVVIDIRNIVIDIDIACP
jgi:hypothetical protein